MRLTRLPPIDVETLRDLLGLVLPSSALPSVEDLCTRSRDERDTAEHWAVREHVGASDNPVKRVAMPTWIPWLASLRRTGGAIARSNTTARGAS